MVFDHPNLVSDSGLLLMSTLARRLGLPALVARWVQTEAPNPAAKVMTLVIVLHFIGEVLATIGRGGVSGKFTVRADSAFWSWKLIDKLTKAGVGWSITVRLVTRVIKHDRCDPRR